MTDHRDRGQRADRAQADHDDDLAGVPGDGVADIGVHVGQSHERVGSTGRAARVAAEVRVLAAFADEVVGLGQHGLEVFAVLRDTRVAGLGAAVGEEPHRPREDDECHRAGDDDDAGDGSSHGRNFSRPC